MKKRMIALILALCTVLLFSGCVRNADALSSGALTIEHETRFGGAYLHMTIDDFCALGFEYGDAVDVRFSNGYELENVPFFNGYYTMTGEPLLCAYPGYPYIKACINNGDDLFETGRLSEDCTAEVTLRERGAFLKVQTVMSMVYTNERDNYASDAVFANFRDMSGGQLADNLFYRAASPCDNQYNRATYSSALCGDAGIAYVLDLADSEEDALGYFEDAELDCPYWKSLYEGGKVLPLAMSSNYRSPAYVESVAEAMRAVIREEGPFLIHCTEGKDRTGFVCLLVEALAGASQEELAADYMVTYDNYYGLNAKNDPEGYDTVLRRKFDDMLLALCDTDDVSKLTPEQLTAGAEQYLALGGLTEAEIRQLEDKITAE